MGWKAALSHGSIDKLTSSLQFREVDRNKCQARELRQQGPRRQAFRRQFHSLSSRLLHRTILDFRLRLVLLAALTLPFILLGGCVHALASGQPWSTSAYLVYGLLFRVPSLGAVRLDEPASSAAVLNAVFLFGTFGFAILLGLIGEEVKGTVKALRAGGTPLDLNGHIVLLNFTADATAVALLRQLAADVGRRASPLYGRPVVVLAAAPPTQAARTAAGVGGAQPAGGGGGGVGGGDVEGVLKRVLADALRGYRSCEWHLRVGSACRTDDLARVCAATASYIVLLADPRVATSVDATAAGAASCLQAQSLMCLSLAMSAGTGAGAAAEQAGPGTGGGGGPVGPGGGLAAVGRVRPAAAGGGPRTSRSHPTIVVQAPRDAPQPAPPGASGGAGCAGGQGLGLGGGPIATFRAVAAAEGSRPAVIEVCDRGIVDRLVAQTVLQPGVATVLAKWRRPGGEQLLQVDRVAGSARIRSGGGGGGAPAAAGRTAAAAAVAAAATRDIRGHPHRAAGRTGGDAKDLTGGDPSMAGLRRRRIFAVPRTLSYSISQRSLAGAAADADATAASAASATTRGGSRSNGDSDGGCASAAGSSEGGEGHGGGDASSRTGPGVLRAFAAAAVAVLASSLSLSAPRRSAGSATASAVATTAMTAATAPPNPTPRRAVADGVAVAAPAACRPKPPPPPLLALPGACNGGGGGGSNSTPYGEVRAVVEAAAAGAVDADGRASRWRRQPPAAPSPGASPGGGGAAAAAVARSLAGWWRGPPGSAPVLMGYMSAATGTLRLNPRDTSPVYPGDKLVLLVSEDLTRGAVSPYASRRQQGCRGRSDNGGGGGGGWALFWGRRGAGADPMAAGDGVGAETALTSPTPTQAGPPPGAGAALWKRRSTAGGGARLLFCGSDTAAAVAAALNGGAPSTVPPRLPLQGWHSGPAEHADDWPPCASGFSAPPYDLRLVTGSEGKQRPSDPSGAAAAADVAAASASGASASGGAGGGGRGGGGGGVPNRAIPARSRTGQRTPGAPPSHIIVISRTAAAVREVLTGLQEFAPAGSTIALVTHESHVAAAAPPPPPPPASRASTCVTSTATAAIAAAAAAACSNVIGGLPSGPAAAAAAPAASSAAAVFSPSTATVAVAAAATGSGSDSVADTVVLPCPVPSWPVSEPDLVIAGLAVATAVLVARDSGLQPHEADATALSAVLQLHQTLTDPTRSPLRRRPPPLWRPAAHCLNGAERPVPPGATDPWVAPTAPSAWEAATAAEAGAAEGLSGGRGGGGDGAATAAPAVVVAAAAEAATAAEGPLPPLHVVVSLHSTAARETLRRFLGGLNAQPPFTLEALVPEEYRALLLAGVVRQPQSHAIMTELLSDRPGSPEVYLLPPGRLLAVAAAAAAAAAPGRAPVASPPLEPPSPPAAAAAPANDLASPSPPPPPPPPPGTESPFQPHGSSRPHPPASSQPLALSRCTSSEAPQPQPQPPPPPSPVGSISPQEGGAPAGPSGWRFRDVARMARACGCTAIGVLRGGGGGGDAGGGETEAALGGGGGCAGGRRRLQLAPFPDLDLDLAAEDRLVVLAADPV